MILVDIYKTLTDHIDISETEWKDYSQMLRTRIVRKKEIIHMQGNICREVFFVRKGLLRIFFIDCDGNEKTFHFAHEGTFATDYESFLKQIPASYSIQALENCELNSMSYEMIQYGYTNLRNGEKLGRLLAEEYFFLFSDKIRAIYTLTPLERYNNLKKEIPSIFQRIPQHYIASFLNISSVHLSRLKKQDR